MRTPPHILGVDDNPVNVDTLRTRLAVHGYEILTAADGEEALVVARAKQPDLILLDVMMPKMDGIQVCRELRADSSLPFMPIILVTAKTDSKDVVAGLEAGGDEYLTKPVDQAALVARVQSMLRVKALHDTVQEQATRLAGQAAELREWNRTLEQRVADQLAELQRVGRLKRFFSPQLAELIVAGGAEDPLKTHRRDVTLGYDLDFGIGIAQGYATIGAIGFEGRWDYGAIGTVTNLAARLCGEARPGQVLVSQRVLAAVEDLVDVETVGDLGLKGFHRPVPAYNVLGAKLLRS